MDQEQQKPMTAADLPGQQVQVESHSLAAAPKQFSNYIGTMVYSDSVAIIFGFQPVAGAGVNGPVLIQTMQVVTHEHFLTVAKTISETAEQIKKLQNG